ncbi:type I DNA topoisomerase [Candidatus Dojkabacteria bacterium]|uniref:DNA topoisomerase n=1 Tax=Candidatus Dojkabacteria bacterium TaxID=2099670 RepID=A0A3M0Z154_9BACT|nr:MAG: type I DNA topoisomerase [Candidatus Dojkabacteria bacterium]
MKSNMSLSRIVFTEVTRDAILNALNNQRRGIDINLVQAQQSRRLLDRIVGYGISPLLWKKITFGLSAGRVQSVALKILVEREIERRNFTPNEYWSFEADFTFVSPSKPVDIKISYINKPNSNESEDRQSLDLNEDEVETEMKQTETFTLKSLHGKNPEIKSKEEAAMICSDLVKRSFLIKLIAKKIVKKNPQPPFKTSTFQQNAVNKLSISSKKAMQIAQRLYEKGHITYIRTDSVHMSLQAVEEARAVIKSFFGEEYLPASINHYENKSPNSQESHECIRPVSFEKTSKDLGLSLEETKVYDLIYKQAIASQMSQQVIQVSTIDVSDADNVYVFRSNHSVVLFPGYNKVFETQDQDFSDSRNRNELYDLPEGSKVYLKSVESIQHFTSPPSRYSEASLIKRLEELGVGRPSTYSTILGVIQQRTYVEKLGKYFVPTVMGETVIKLLDKYFENIVDYYFTAKVEYNLDQIAEGKLKWDDYIRDFYNDFDKKLKYADETIKRGEFTELGLAPESIKCPNCRSGMLIKLGRFGKFYSCSRFPECSGIIAFETEQSDKKIKGIDLKDIEPPPRTEDGRDYNLKKGQYGYFWAHPDYPKMKDVKPINFNRAFIMRNFKEIPTTGDGREFTLRLGRFGYFWAHPEYPKIRQIIKIPKDEIS